MACIFCLTNRLLFQLIMIFRFFSNNHKTHFLFIYWKTTKNQLGIMLFRYIEYKWNKHIYWQLFLNMFHRKTTTKPFCWIFFVFFIHWWDIRVNYMLQGRSRVTAPKQYSSLYRIWTLRHLLQRTTRCSYLSWRIWTIQCLHWIVWSSNRG